MNNHEYPTAVAEGSQTSVETAPKPGAWDDFESAVRPGFAQRHGALLGVLAAIGLGALIWFWNDIFPKQKGVVARRENQVVVNVPPPPPPPPPPLATPPPPPPEDKMIEQTPVENEPKPEEPVDEPPPADLATGIAGNGPPDGFGLTGRSGTGVPGGTGNKRGGQGSRFGNYAGQVQSKIQQAIQSNPKTRYANLRAEVRIWADSTGRVTRATLANSTGNPTTDAALRDDVLTGLPLPAGLPADMPMPIVMRINIRRPN